MKMISVYILYVTISVYILYTIIVHILYTINIIFIAIFESLVNVYIVCHHMSSAALVISQ